MRKAYEVFAWVIAGLVAVQASAIAYFGSGESRFIEEGGVVDKALVESAQQGGPLPFPEAIGILVHGMNGMMLIPLVALILLGVSFGAGFDGARKWAGIIVLLVIVQVLLGFSQHGLPAVGVLHGANAFLIFASAFHAARLGRRSASAPVSRTETAAPA